MVVVLAQIVAIMLGRFVFMPYSGYMVVFSLYLYLRCISPFPAFSSRNNVGDPSREDRKTALMRCMHHLRAASGEMSSFHGTGAVWKERRVWWGFFCLVISIYILLLCYIAIYLYIYIVIALFIYSVVCLLLYCMLTAWGYYFLYIYILFLFLTSTSIFYDSGCRLSINWLFTVQRYGGSVRYQTPGDALFG